MIANEDFLVQKEVDYSEYNKLNAYQRRVLPANNWWRRKLKLKMIEVPKEDKYYWKWFHSKAT
jgi:hypothetical protein